MPTEGPDQAERDGWSRVIESAIRALPRVIEASHWFDYDGKYRKYASRLDVRLEDGATPDEVASVVSVMGTQQLPSHYRGDQTEVNIARMTGTYSAYWRFGRDVSREVNSAHTWARLSAPGTEVFWRSSGIDVDHMSNSIDVGAGSDAEPRRATAEMRRIIQDFPELAPNDWTVHTVGSESKYQSSLGPGWINTDRRRRPYRPGFPSNSELELWEWFVTDQPTPYFVKISTYDPPGNGGRTLDVEINPPAGTQFTTAQATQLAERHLPYLAQPGAVVDYTINWGGSPDFAVLIGGCRESWRDVIPESKPFASRYERC